MNIELNIPTIALIISVIGHAFFTVWSAASFKTAISSKMDNLVEALRRMDRELEKRDAVISAVWKKIDGINERVMKIETKVEN